MILVATELPQFGQHLDSEHATLEEQQTNWAGRIFKVNLCHDNVSNLLINIPSSFFNSILDREKLMQK